MRGVLYAEVRVLSLIALVLSCASATAQPAPQEAGWAIPIPEAAIKVEERGGEARFRDARSPKVVVSYFREAFAGLEGASCSVPRGEDAPLLRCKRTVRVDDKTVEDLVVEVRPGKAATEIRTAREFRVAGVVVQPPEIVIPPAPVPYSPLDPLSD